MSLFLILNRLVRNSTPIVEGLSRRKVFLEKRERRLVFPTPESPNSITTVNKTKITKVVCADNLVTFDQIIRSLDLTHSTKDLKKKSDFSYINMNLLVSLSTMLQ